MDLKGADDSFGVVGVDIAGSDGVDLFEPFVQGLKAFGPGIGAESLSY
jgi:hypothetical protein